MAHKKNFFQKISRRMARKVALFSLAAIGSASLILPEINRPKSIEKEKLTQNEIEFIESIYGDGFDTQAITKRMVNRAPNDSPLQGYVYSHEQYNVQFVGEHYEDDFTKGNKKNLLVFSHEANHLIEHQKEGFFNLALAATFKLAGAKRQEKDLEYGFNLQKDDLFDSFGNEQRAEIMKTYTRMFVVPYMKDVKGYTASRCYIINDIWLRDIVEEKYPQAKITRLNNEAENPAVAQEIYAENLIPYTIPTKVAALNTPQKPSK